MIVDLDDYAKSRRFTDGEHMTARCVERLRLVRKLGVNGEVPVRLDWGRWLCDCPYCGGAELVSRERREFYCLSCGMEENGHQAMRAVFPENWQEIEARLANDKPSQQNWRP